MAAPGTSEVITLPVGPLPREVMVAMDVGGSLAKIVYVDNKKDDRKRKQTDVQLLTFDTEDLDQCLEHIRQNVMHNHNNFHVTVRATGVGCKKYEDRITEYLGVNLEAQSNEMDHAARGVDFLWRHLPPEKLLYSNDDSQISDLKLKFKTSLKESGVLPCLLVNMGSALTIAKINADMQSQAPVVGGSIQGGLMFLGLGALLTRARSFDSLIQLAERGDHKNVDLLIKDTAGSSYNRYPSEGMVSSFGKVSKQRTKQPGAHFSEEDIANSLLYCITDQMAQTTYLVARCEGIHTAVFCGSFFSTNQTVLQLIRSKLDMCSRYLPFKVTPLFMKNERYLGALGALAGQFPQLCDSNHDS